MHQGTIELKSKQGSEFVITLLKGNSHLQPAEISQKVENLTSIPSLITDNLNIEPDLKIQTQFLMLKNIRY